VSIRGGAVRRTGKNGKEEQMSKYVFLYLDDGVDHQTDPTPEQQKVYREIFQWFTDNGSKFADSGEELQPTRTATTIRKDNGKVTVVDGPFVESKESVGGFSVVEVPDRAAAIALAKTWPGHGIEIREVKEN